MKTLSLYVIVALAMIFGSQVQGQEKAAAKDEWKKDLKLDFNFFNRTRYMATKVDSNDFSEFFKQKTIFGMNAKVKEMGQVVFQLRNTSTLGTGYENNYVGDNLAVYQAYGQFKLPFGEKSCLYFGRKEINIDTQYIFGAVGFHDEGKTFDTIGIVTNLMEKKLKLNIFSVRQSELDGTAGSNDEFMTVLHAQYQLNKMMGFSFLYLNDVVSVSDVTAKNNTKNKGYMGHLLGLRAHGKLDMGLAYNTEFYLQFGDDVTIGAASVNTTKGASRMAYAFLLDVNYQLKDLGPKPTFGLLLNINSGDDKADETNKNFFVAMGTKHKFFGYMDKYLGTNNWGNQGIMDISLYAKWQCVMCKKLSFKFDYHYFMPMVKHIATDKKQSLGMEFDLTAKLKINKMFSFVGIFGYFMPGDLHKKGLAIDGTFEADKIEDKQIFTYGALQVKF